MSSGIGDWVKRMGIDNTGPGSGMPMMPGDFIKLALMAGPPPKAPAVVDECPTCKAGRLENGVASLPNECCAIYFFGERSSAHDMWKMTEGAKRRVYNVRAARMSGGAEAAPEEDESALRKRLTGLGRDALVEEIVRLRAEARDRRWDRDPKR